VFFLQLVRPVGYGTGALARQEYAAVGEGGRRMSTSCIPEVTLRSGLRWVV